MNQQNLYKQVGENEYIALVDIYEPNKGALLAREGSKFSFDSTLFLNRFREKNNFSSSPKKKVLGDCIFLKDFKSSKKKLNTFFESIKNRQKDSLEETLEDFSDSIINLADRGINPLIGISYLDSFNQQTESRAIYRATISLILAKNLGLSEVKKKEALKVSLLSDLSLIEYEEELSKKELSKKVKEAILNKKINSKSLLEKIGFEDFKLSQSIVDNSISSKIYDISSTFTGLMIPQDYVHQKQKKINSAVSKLFLLAQDNKLESNLVISLIKGNNSHDSYYFGKFPPGSILSLRNGRYVIVTRPSQYNKNNGSWITCPTVRTFVNADSSFTLSKEYQISNPMDITAMHLPEKFHDYFSSKDLSDLWSLKKFEEISLIYEK